MSKRPVALAWSGGKDSAMALAALRADPNVEVVALVTTMTVDYDRISIHGVRRSVLAAQVASIGIPMTEVAIPAAASNAVYEQALAQTLSALRERHGGLDRIAFGDLFLADVRAYRERLLAGIGWEPVFPLWGIQTARLAREFIDRGFCAILTCVDTTRIDAAFAGRRFDAALLADLPPTADPCGENGEFHTCVYAGPVFSRPLALRTGERVLRDGRFQYCDVLLDGAADSAA
jgi:uncharacterized protein (TIGR00290 family)